MMIIRRALLFLLVLFLLLPAHARAQVRAWLDRDRIGLGEAVTLTVEGPLRAAPDFGPLVRDFSLDAHASRQQLEWVNGRLQARSQYTVTLRPRRPGLLRIPALRAGVHATAPVTLLVTAGASPSAAPAPVSGRGREVFIESEADDLDPYVQQSVGWVVRLYAAVPLMSGKLDQTAPDGATLQRVGDDIQYRRIVGGRDYLVIERRYMLIPERSGELAMPSARFDGRGAGNVFDRLFGDGQSDLVARAAPRILRVRPIPADAPQPWLPLHGLVLRYSATPQRLRAGEAGNLTVEVEADGAAASQLPALELPAVPGLEIFAEPPQVEESLVDARPRAKLRQRFSIVPSRGGTYTLPGATLSWWDVRVGRARSSRLPPLVLDVGPGVASGRSDGRGGADAGPAIDGIPSGAKTRPRIVPALGGVLAALLVGVWLWRQRTRRPRSAAAAGTADPPPSAEPSFARLLEEGDLADIEDRLRRLAGNGASLDTVIQRLAEPAQQEAVDALRRARWAGGDPREARERLRSAFAGGPVWRTPAAADAPLLPPLYPR